MNRVIKFRAWDEGKMLYDIAVKNSYAFKDGKHLSVKDGEIQYSIMQYTGLIDKKGVECYDGDIIIGRHVIDSLMNMTASRYKVIWDDCGWCAQSLDVNISDCWLIFFEHNITAYPRAEFEIIGNIHQNPDLLTQTT